MERHQLRAHEAPAVKERSRRYKSTFFADVVDGRIASEQNAASRRQIWLQGCAHLCISIAPARRSPRCPKTGTSDKERLYELVKREAKSEGLTSFYSSSMTVCHAPPFGGDRGKIRWRQNRIIRAAEANRE
ncbi:hypothetical protein ACFSKT_00035 [Paenibacillus xanthanilyticus]|uniref:hypothetical protein n=1 Tax=Paenibacillus xanthanilyticus TaxID=1783531 RepID=UPI00363A3D4A